MGKSVSMFVAMFDENGNYYGTVIAFVVGKFGIVNEQSGEREDLTIEQVAEKKLQIKIV